jgi:hypothetical protein
MKREKEGSDRNGQNAPKPHRKLWGAVLFLARQAASCFPVSTDSTRIGTDSTPFGSGAPCAIVLASAFLPERSSPFLRSSGEGEGAGEMRIRSSPETNAKHHFSTILVRTSVKGLSLVC